MTHREQVDAAVADLLARGVRKASAAPPAYRLAWRLGLPVRPPHYQTFLGHVFTVGSFTLVAAVAFVLAAWAVTARVPFGGFREIAAVLLLIAAVGSLTSAAYYGASAWWRGLPAWEEFAPDVLDDADW
jgi:hypothetical protein